MTTPRKTLAAALALAFALAAAGCGNGGAQTDVAPAETAAPPAATTTAPPPATSEDGCAEAEAETAQARVLMARAETADGPPTAEKIEQIAEARWGALFDRRRCEGENIWGDGDEARLDALAARVGEAETGEGETGEGEAGDEADSEDGSDGGGSEDGEAAGGETGTAAPAAEPTTAPEGDGQAVEQTDPAPEPEQPPPTTVFEDRGPEIPEDQATDRQQTAWPVVLEAPVKLGTWTEHLCPDEAELTAGGWASCGADIYDPLDWLSPNAVIFAGCYHPPVRLGVGDRYLSVGPLTGRVPVDDIIGYRQETTREILGFSAPELSTDRRWAWVTAQVRSTRTFLYDKADGTTEREDHPGGPTTGPALRWVQVGGEAGRTLAADGTLASGLLAVNPELPNDAPPC